MECDGCTIHTYIPLVQYCTVNVGLAPVMVFAQPWPKCMQSDTRYWHYFTTLKKVCVIWCKTLVTSFPIKLGLGVSLVHQTQWVIPWVVSEYNSQKYYYWWMYYLLQYCRTRFSWAPAPVQHGCQRQVDERAWRPVKGRQTVTMGRHVTNLHT